MKGRDAYLHDGLFTSLKRDSFHGNVIRYLVYALVYAYASYYGLQQSQGTWCIVSSSRELSREYIRSHSRRNFGPDV